MFRFTVWYSRTVNSGSLLECSYKATNGQWLIVIGFIHFTGLEPFLRKIFIFYLWTALKPDGRGCGWGLHIRNRSKKNGLISIVTRLSAFLIVKNEADDLPACLRSLKGLADEIVIVDSGSTDGTIAIARDEEAKTFFRSFDHFSAQKQYALDQCTGEWALSIDADERVTPALADAIRTALTNPTADGYELHRQMFFLGRRLRFGGVGIDWPLRLFRRTKGRYRPVTVHESIEVDGRVDRIDAPLLHYSYDTLQEYLSKCDHYTTLSARALFEQGRRYSVFDHLRPLWETFSRIVLRGAWLDGSSGLIYAALSAHATWLRAIKLWELQKSFELKVKS